MGYPKTMLITLVLFVTRIKGQYQQPQNLVDQNTGTLLHAVPGSQGRPLPVFQNLPGDRLPGTGNSFSHPLGTAPATSGTSPRGGVGSSPQFIGFPQSLGAYLAQGAPAPDERFSQIIARGPDVDTTQSFIGVPASGAVFAQGIGGSPALDAGFSSGPSVGAAQSFRSGATFAQGLASGQISGVTFASGPGVGSVQSIPTGSAPRAGFSHDIGSQINVIKSDRSSQVNVPRVTSGPGANIIRNFGSQEVRRVDALLTPTVTQIITIDRCVTVTDQAFNSVAVTLTSFSVQTVTVGTRAVLQTPVDDRVALQTSVFVRPGTVTITEVKSDFRIVTETSLTHVTLAHTSYVISQYTFTTTATQVLTYTATLVHTNISTHRTTFTNFRTVTDTVYVNSGYGYRQQ
ncbi:uncharacterized protein [Procambarus clarkii]|uniref:uncharacterized protein n=1 Tax=Procambarus clarkii TaxID=6728 RepID=UPI001E671C90|nr:uncharacterized protein LOC123766105 [Procambarus clarkii]